MQLRFLAAAVLTLVGGFAHAEEQRGVIQVSMTVVPQCQVETSANAETKAVCSAGAAYRVDPAPAAATSDATLSAVTVASQILIVTF